MNLAVGNDSLLDNAFKQAGVSRNNGVFEKVLAMIILGFGSFISGMLPAIISERNRSRFPLAISMLLCFGAGVLLATALVHILPEAIQHTHGHDPSGPGPSCDSNSYGAINERAPLLGGAHASTSLHHPPDEGNNGYGTSACDEEQVEVANASICHTSHTEPCVESITGTLGLLAALSLHSAIEGLAIGVQNSATKVLFLLGAVACHKFVMGFCLGLTVRMNGPSSLRSQFIGISVFALGAVCGIALGMFIADIPTGWSQTTLPIIQALAGGTLLYVTVCEVMPREKARWHSNNQRRWAGFAQFISVTIGFAIMCIINYYLADE
ncbi:zinc transporter ZIP1 isoform X2 [Drosophila willistoni]|uniref:zinc transporter ZIP1 isoform X2 n=1 Tax=Drosophila willistoni TaxID=7260 RepID=UPI000C26D483|nr:zinc transporter ZIP1 isoform X2 [Drosophila willistoni]